MPEPGRRRAEDLADEERERIRLVHQRLRKASQDLEAFTATKRLRGRWEPAPVPPEVVDGARATLARACGEVWRTEEELLGWDPPGDPAG